MKRFAWPAETTFASSKRSITINSMGIPGGHQIFWKTTKLKLDQALSAVRQLKEENLSVSQQNIGHTSHPSFQLTVAVDANLVGYKYIAAKSTFTPSSAVMHVAKALSEKHVKVCDC